MSLACNRKRRALGAFAALAGMLSTAGLSADAPRGRYTHDTQDTTYDSVTKLTWQRDPGPAVYTQPEALGYCEQLELTGDDWRLPSRAELLSLVDPTRINPAIDRLAFPRVPARRFWSSSAYVPEPGSNWYVDFASGESQGRSETASLSVLCVRD
jgi:hypothetical protein